MYEDHPRRRDEKGDLLSHQRSDEMKFLPKGIKNHQILLEFLNFERELIGTKRKLVRKGTKK